MIGVRDLITKLNDELTNPSLTELEINQLYAAIDSIEKRGVSSVPNVVSLPDPVTNKGRFFYITSENRYVYSNGVTWSINNIFRTANTNAFTWGNNLYGQLGDLTTNLRNSPTSVSGNISNWTQISINRHAVALRTNGTAWAWGCGTSGQLGDSTAVTKSSPVSVVGGITNWVQISVGSAHSVGLRANGTAWAWGVNSGGQLGDNTTVNKSSPVAVYGGISSWKQISAGKNGSHTLALRADGTAWAWGVNSSGQLGDNTLLQKSSPVAVVGGITNWIQLSGGSNHSLGLRANGIAMAWGINTNGRLGDNTTVGKSSPVSVVGGFTDWIQLTAGTSHSVGIRANGTAWAWGNNYRGALGDNTTTPRSSPVSVVGGFTDWVQLDAGGYSTIGLRANGTVWSWGDNNLGQLGNGINGFLASRSSPVSIVGGFSDWIQVSAGDTTRAAIRG